jgi:aminomethyltransferase
VLLWARGVALRSGLTVSITEPDVSPLQVQGPKARPLIQDLFGDRAAQLGYYYFLETALDGIPLVLTRTGWTGEVGYEIYLRDGSRGDDLWERVMAAGKAYQLRPTGPSDIRRVEAGILNWGADMTLENNVYEVGLDRLVDEAKADYIGRDALRRIKAAGVRRHLVGVEIEGSPIEFNATRWPVRTGGRPLGQVTSALYSPRLRKNIGYAYVPSESAGLGTRLSVLLPSGERAATVVPRPFLDPHKAIPKG